MKNILIIVGIIFSVLVVLIYVPDIAYRQSERRYYLDVSAQCIAIEVAKLIQSHYKINGKYPVNNNIMAAIVKNNKNNILCGPDLSIHLYGEFVDSKGEKLIYVNEETSALIYSVNQGQEYSKDNKYYHGYRVHADIIEEIRIEKKAL